MDDGKAVLAFAGHAMSLAVMVTQAFEPYNRVETEIGNNGRDSATRSG